ncbi:MAG: hypothetical protein ACYC8T_15120 [Myxococcaceae bacterium]
MRALVIACVLSLAAPAAGAKSKKKAPSAPAIAPEASAGAEDLPGSSPPTLGADIPDAEGPWAFDGEARLTTGGFSGYGVRKDGGGMARPEVRAAARFRREGFQASLPVALSHRQTVGAALVESKGSAGLELRYRFSPKLRVSLEGGLLGVRRPGWPDLYQPLAGGGYQPTDRYSHFDGKLEAQVAGIPLRHQHARLKYQYTGADYAIDPAFRSSNPTHLTPFGYHEHALRGSWRYLADDWKAGGKLSAFSQGYAFMFSRDANTGLTHAGPGGAPPNPLQVFTGVEPAVEGEWKRGGLELSGSYGLELVVDAFEGYYSFTGHHPELKVEYGLPQRASLTLGAEAWVRTYGDSSYQAGGSHPPLTSGTRRVDNRVALTFGAELPLRPDLTLTADLSWVRRVTNFPPYQPGVYPANRTYDIDWSYTNFLAQVGVRWVFLGAGGAAKDD